MVIEVLYFADFKEITGKNKEEFKLKNNSIEELIKILINKYVPFRNLIWDDKKKELKNSISIAINDTLIQNKDKLAIKLSDGDKIAFLLPVSGG